MLKELHIRNFALIEELELSFYSGFSVLTGETGAGKSIIIDALSLLLGARASVEMIRSGAESSVIEGSFSVIEEIKPLLVEWGYEEDEELILAREIYRSGRNKCRVNGRLATAGQLAELGSFLVDIVGQHDSQSLLKTGSHLKLLDSFGSEKHAAAVREVEALYQKWLAIRQEQKRLASDERERNRRIDLLEFQIEEINGANLKIGEEEELSLKQSRLNNLDRLRRAVEYAHLTLAGSDEQEESIMLRLGRAEGELRRAAALDSSLEPLVESYVGASLQLEELNRELRGYLEGLAADPNLLQEVELRLDLIANLKRKYGATVKEIIEYGQSAEKELADLKNSEVRFDELESEAQRAAADWLAAAGGLSQARKKLGGELEKRIESELADLNMKNTKFSVQFSEQLNNEPRPGGLENVEFMISPNPGEELKPLAKIASGGELSRIMLALKAILAQAEGIPTVIFDEIDAGLGGRTAVNLGEKLYHLGNFRQVFCVTHLPVIAGYASNHYSVRKFTEEERTKVAAAFLAKEERVSELARMLGGEAGEDITYEHAQKLLGRAYGS